MLLEVEELEEANAAAEEKAMELEEAKQAVEAEKVGP